MKLIRFLLAVLLALTVVLAAALLILGPPKLPAAMATLIPQLPTSGLTATTGPTPTPTLTPAQHEAASAALLAQGKRQRADGDYEEAIASLAEATFRHPSASSTTEARFLLGECYRLKDENRLALATFQEVLKLSPGSAFTATATFLAGLSAESMGDRQTAIGYYREHARLRPLVAGYVAFRLGDLYRDSGDAAAALKSYQEAAGAGLPPSPTVDALERAALVQVSSKDWAGAIKSYQAILEIARNPTYRSTILYRLGQAYQSAGQTRQAAETFAGVANDYAETGNAEASLKALDALGTGATGASVDAYQRALVYFHAGSYPEAIAAWRRYVDAAPKGEGTAWARYYIGLSLQYQGEYTAAIGEYDTLVARYQGSAAVPEARLARARCMRLLGNESGSAAEYLATARANPGTGQGQRGLWAAGLGLYRLGNLTGALAAWDELLAAYPKDENRTRTLFWSGKAMLALARTADGRKRLTEAAAENPPGHYALRAADLLGSDPLPRPTPQTSPAGTPPGGDPAADRASVEAWVAGWAPAQPAREGARERLLAEPHFARGRELTAMSLAGDANEEYRLAQEALGGDAWALLEMTYLLRSEALNHYAVTAATKVLSMSPARWAGAAPEAVQRLLYPLEYRSLLEAAAAQYKVDSRVLASLIRQESLFSAAATSSADARGLTQVIPSTAKSIATALGTRDFRLTDLYRPRLSLQFGAYYLSEMLRLTKGDVSMALASYNGGYGNAVRWAGGETPIDQDLFLENVTYSETQSYLQAVGRNLRILPLPVWVRSLIHRPKVQWPRVKHAHSGNRRRHRHPGYRSF